MTLILAPVAAVPFVWTTRGTQNAADVAQVASLALAVPALISALFAWRQGAIRAHRAEVNARSRLQEAERSFTDALRSGVLPTSNEDSGETTSEPTSPVETAPGDHDRASPVSEDRLALAALWRVTHERLDLYHRIATSQARRSFLTAQVAMTAGFVLLVVFAVAAARSATSAGTITTGALGAAGAAFAAYIGRTFVRSQESSAQHLRAYFDQPLDFSRYLAAERLLAAAPQLTSEEHTAILTALVQAITAPPINPSGGSSSPAEKN
jgi:hypothetical protein